ncbi:antibiotic biosynthesis monooxygenase family protein [Rhizomonospora bruguierae]|uniref:antibiotic biosynthesis monooxygenase family protein n=1 Tax=Rhizomonospora bruguierae TaxID=1581705 RepID=UPI001BCBF176|nr:antibiotic biosynthesis monooxygenase [Micromonospora sp. NBRC 107566]
MLVVNRFVVADEEAFVGRAHTALAALAARPGYLSGRLTRALDEPEQWCLLTEWESVGAYRRALGAFEVKVSATPLLAESLAGPSAFEELATAPPGGAVTVMASDRAGSEDGRRGGDARTTIAE